MHGERTAKAGQVLSSKIAACQDEEGGGGAWYYYTCHPGWIAGVSFPGGLRGAMYTGSEWEPFIPFEP
jgi:hypothetical protein